MLKTLKEKLLTIIAQGPERRRLFDRMVSYVDAIKLAAYRKLVLELTPEHGREEAGTLAAAVVNRIFASPESPLHENLDRDLVDRTGSILVSSTDDPDLFLGIVLSLRTLMTIETDSQNREATDRIRATLEWIKGSAALPAESPDPENLERLATTLGTKYLFD